MPRTSFPSLASVAAAGLILAACAQTVETGPQSPAPAAPPPIAVPQPVETPPQEPAAEGPVAVVIGEDTVKVAMLVPLTGRAAGVGNALRNAAEMALFDVADDRFAISFHDTGSTPDGARMAADAALAGGARLIVGPLFGGATARIGPLARAAGVPVVSFSNDVTVAGDGVWVFGLLPGDQIQRIVGYAAGEGARAVAALVPATAYGDAVQAALIDAAARAQLPPPPVGRYPASADTTELSEIVAGFAARIGRPYVTPEPTDPAAPRPPRPDRPEAAVLIPDGGAALRSIAPLLAFHDIDPDRTLFLGSALWSDPDLGREKTLVGGVFAAPSPALRQSFEDRYRALHGETPPGLASLGYDAVSMAAVLARRPGGPAFDTAGLTEPSGFLGAGGVFRLLPDGGNERGLAVLRVTRQGSEIADPAPRSFEALIN